MWTCIGCISICSRLLMQCCRDDGWSSYCPEFSSYVGRCYVAAMGNGPWRGAGSLVHVKLARLYTWNWLACARDTSSCSVDLCGWCREWYVELWRCVAGAAPVWHLVAGAVDWSILVALERGSGWLVQGMVRCMYVAVWRCVAGAAPVWHLVAGDWSILVALERGSGWLVQGRVRCSVTLWRNTSVTFGGRRSRLKHPGSVGVWVWVAGAGNTLHVRCSVTLRGRRSTSATFGGRWLKHPGSVGAWLWVAGAGKGTLQCDVVWQAQHQCDIWWQAQSIEVPGSVGAWLWVAGAGNGTLQYDIARQAQHYLVAGAVAVVQFSTKKYFRTTNEQVCIVWICISIGVVTRMIFYGGKLRCKLFQWICACFPALEHVAISVVFDVPVFRRVLE